MDFLQFTDAPAQSYTFDDFQFDFQYNQLADTWSFSCWRGSDLLIGGRLVVPGFDLLDGIPDADRLVDKDNNAPQDYTFTPRSIDTVQEPITGTCPSPQTRVVMAFALPGIRVTEDQYSALLRTETFHIIASTRGELSQLLLER